MYMYVISLTEKGIVRTFAFNPRLIFPTDIVYSLKKILFAIAQHLHFCN